MTSPYYQYGLELQNNGTRPVLQIGTAAGVQVASMTSTLTKGVWSQPAIAWNSTDCPVSTSTVTQGQTPGA